MKRKGMGKGLGKGYRNIAPMDSHIHSLSAKGVKTIKDRLSKGDKVWIKPVAFDSMSEAEVLEIHKDHIIVDEFGKKELMPFSAIQDITMSKGYDFNAKGYSKAKINRLKKTIPYGIQVHQVEEEGHIFWTVDVHKDSRLLQTKTLTPELWNSIEFNDTDREFVMKEQWGYLDDLDAKGKKDLTWDDVAKKFIEDNENFVVSIIKSMESRKNSDINVYFDEEYKRFRKLTRMELKPLEDLLTRPISLELRKEIQNRIDVTKDVRKRVREMKI